MEFYRGQNGYGNAIHLYLTLQNKAEGLPNTDLIDRKRESAVYEAVERDVFSSREEKVIQKTGLGFILDMGEELSAEDRLRQAIFGKDAVLSGVTAANRIVRPMIFTHLREAYDKIQSGEWVKHNQPDLAIKMAYNAVANDVAKILREGLRAVGDEDVKKMLSEKTDLLKDRIGEVLESLTYREREIIKLRYGIGDGCTYTMEDVGRIFKVTRERVRQVEAKAIRKLQHPIRARKLEGFLDNPEESQ